MLFVVNAGDSTLSVFGIDKADPTKLTPLGTPQNTMGLYPVSVAYSGHHKTACVLNSAGQANIACFSVSKKGLSPLSNSVRLLDVTQTNPPKSGVNTVSDILFNHDHSRLLVSVKGDPAATPGFIANFQITTPFKLSQTAVKSTPDKAVFPFGMKLVGDSKDIVLDADPRFGVSVSKLSPVTGAIVSSSSLAIINQTAICWSSYSPSTGNFYLTDAGNAQLTEVSVSHQGPTVKLVSTKMLEGIGGRIDQIVASTPIGDFLYVLAPTAGAVNVVKLGGVKKINEIQLYDVRSKVTGLSITMQGLAVFIK